MLFSSWQNLWPQTPVLTAAGTARDSAAQSAPEDGGRQGRRNGPPSPWSPAATRKELQGTHTRSPGMILTQPPTIFNSEDFLSLLWLARSVFPNQLPIWCLSGLPNTCASFVHPRPLGKDLKSSSVKDEDQTPREPLATVTLRSPCSPRTFMICCRLSTSLFSETSLFRDFQLKSAYDSLYSLFFS